VLQPVGAGARLAGVGHREHGGPRRSRAATAELELLAPDPTLFGGAAEASTTRSGAGPDGFDDDGPPRSATAVAGLLVAAVVAVGVLAAAPWSGDDAAPVPPTTAATTTTGVAPSTTTAPSPRPDLARADGAYLATPPPGFEVRDAGRRRQVARISEWFELWSTPGATRTRGSWFALQIGGPQLPLWSQGGRRVEVAGGVGLVRDTVDGIHELRYERDGVGVTITSFGWTDAGVATLVDSLEVSADRPPVLHPVQLASAHRRLLWAPRSFGTLERQYLETGLVWEAEYERPSDGAWFGVAVARADSEAETLARFVLVTSDDRPLSGPSVRLDVAGRAVTSGTLPGGHGPALQVARWREPRPAADDVVTVVGDLRLSDLLEIVPTVTPATEARWADALAEARQRWASAYPTAFTTVGVGTLSAGGEWRFAVDPSGTYSQVLLPGRGFEWRTMVLGRDPLTVLAVRAATVVVAQPPDELGATRLRVTTVAGTTELDLVPIDPTGNAGAGPGRASSAAAFAFDELGPMTAELLDAGGAVVVTIAN